MTSLKDILKNLTLEIMHAQSSLNMPPDPLPNSNGGALSQTDGWARHAAGHLHLAFEISIEAEEILKKQE